jgi:hypothetical protein
MRSDRRADQVIARLDRGHPVAERFADRVLEGARARGDGAHLGAEQAHAVDVQRLTPHVFLAHVDHALQTEHGAHRRSGDAVLAGARLGDDAPRPWLRERPTDGIVDRRRYGPGRASGRPTALDTLSEAARLVQRGRAAPVAQ